MYVSDLLKSFILDGLCHLYREVFSILIDLVFIKQLLMNDSTSILE